jgi:NTP pyrophosphatase (non-canonical NTP hydrolase)
VWEVVRNRNKRDEIAEEMADILIYLLYLADAIGVDMEEEFLKKVKKNAERYPVEKAKGIAKKYTEL